MDHEAPLLLKPSSRVRQKTRSQDLRFLFSSNVARIDRLRYVEVFVDVGLLVLLQGRSHFIQSVDRSPGERLVSDSIECVVFFEPHLFTLLYAIVNVADAIV